MTDIGLRIKIQRISKGMRQEELAEKLGFTKSTISGWETGAKEPSLQSIGRLCELFHISPNYLMGMGPEETFKMDEKEKRMLTIYKEQMPEKLKEAMLAIASFAHDSFAGEEDFRTFYSHASAFIRDNGLRQLWNVYQNEDIDKDEVVCRRIYRRKRIREFMEQLLKEDMPAAMNEGMTQEYKLIEEEEEKYGDRL